jgi:sec-independent protein translocase protein TatA
MIAVAFELSVLQMTIGASEWGIIILLVLILLISSNKFSTIGRFFGQAAGEYEKAKELIRKEKENSLSRSRGFPASFIPPVTNVPVSSEREKLEIIARSLGIDDTNKTDEDLRALIYEKMQKQ